MRPTIGGAVATAEISRGRCFARILLNCVLALLFVPGVIGAVAPANGSPDDDPSTAVDAAFLAALHAAGITYSDAGKSITAGQTMCDYADQGKSEKALVATLQKHNEELTSERARLFIAIALHAYCPQHLADTMQGVALQAREVRAIGIFRG
ncbi:DUF732 domain-containing protein [[Mycobacterium] zoologicum]|uniref:DUF732 domain-containing protein n=1 Tax=[Mycobacterium] zoologicum TaxID=2872311 RepID=UPI001CDB2818|nr:DUF732 domain-containing protein [Mycolicibacter sp. MYC101]MEB3062083.1 DUF732 domain-containing protein [Mycolicibacter sp. MYC101]